MTPVYSIDKYIILGVLIVLFLISIYKVLREYSDTIE